MAVPIRFGTPPRGPRHKISKNNPMQSRMGPGSWRPCRPRPDLGWSVFTAHPDLDPGLSVVVALALFDGHDVRARHASREGRQRLDRLFAPFRHGALVGEADAKAEQLADIGRRRRAIRESLIEEALVAGETVAVMFQSRHQVGAQRLDVDAVERIQPHQKVVLDRGRNAWPGGPMPE